MLAKSGGKPAMRTVQFPALRQNQHIAKIADHFGGLEGEFVPPTGDTSYVFLCFTNRCGSNFLSELLASSGQYNRAGEMLNWAGVIDRAKRHKLRTFQDFFARFVSRQRKSGHFFMKVALPHLDLLARSKVLDHVINNSRFILLERLDRLAQAISYLLAFETGSFTSKQIPSKAPEDIEFSRERIDRFLEQIALSYEQFEMFFGENGIVPLRVNYERVVANPESETAWLMRELGLPHSGVVFDKLNFERQSGPMNALWRERYLNGAVFSAPERV
jgi:LPS sulfotransferase NodH